MAGMGKLAWATYSQNRGSHPSPKLNRNESSALDAVKKTGIGYIPVWKTKGSGYSNLVAVTS